MIKIDRIFIQNFKRYRQVEIKPEPGPGIFVFIGKNYLGKSNFLNAICWCLYEEEPFTQSIEKTQIPNQGILNEDAEQENEFADVSVEIQVSNEGSSFKFVRSMRKTQNAKFFVYRLVGKDWKEVPNPETVREMLLPKDLRKYFIFAGENLERLYSSGFEKELKEGIWKVSDIRILDKAIEHINVMIPEIRRKAGEGNADKEPIILKMEECEESKKKNEINLKQREAEVLKLKKLQVEYRDEQKKYDKVKTLVEKQELLENEYSKIQDDEAHIINKINDLLTERSPFIYAKETIEAFYKSLSSQESQGKLPPDIQVDFISELKKRGFCICERKIDKDDGSAAALDKLIAEYETASSLSSLLGDKYIASSIIREIEDFKEELIKLKGERGKAIARKNDIDRELKEIKGKLADSNISEVSNIERALQDLDQKIEDQNRAIGSLISQVKNDEKNLRELAVNLERIKDKNDQSKKENEIKSFLELSSEALDHVRQRITDRVRRVLSHDTEKYFRELFWDEEQFEKIEFTDDYNLYVKMKNSERPKTQFAMGEGKVLGLATMRAIAEMSGFNEVPIFFDAPLSNLGGEIRHNLLEVLHQLAPNKQVFIFSLDDKEMLEYIENHMPKNRVFQLKKDPKNLHSTIITKYYD